MGLVEDLIASLNDGVITDVRIGLHWTAVKVRVDDKFHCGLSSTLQTAHKHGGEPMVPQAGELQNLTGLELAALANEQSRSTLASIGVATINALLPSPQPESWIAGNAGQILATRGAGKRVAIVGRFPFIPKIQTLVGELFVLDENPQEGEYPPDAAPNILPSAEIVAITGMAIANHTMEGLLSLCQPESLVMVLGPSTPFSTVMFNYGVHLLSGSVVTAIAPVVEAVSQGGNFQQIHQAGVQLVTVERPAS